MGTKRQKGIYPGSVHLLWAKLRAAEIADRDLLSSEDKPEEKTCLGELNASFSQTGLSPFGEYDGQASATFPCGMATFSFLIGLYQRLGLLAPAVTECSRRICHVASRGSCLIWLPCYLCARVLICPYPRQHLFIFLTCIGFGFFFWRGVWGFVLFVCLLLIHF